MSNRSILPTLPREVILNIFRMVYEDRRLEFRNGQSADQLPDSEFYEIKKVRTSATNSWVPGQDINPMLICKTLSQEAKQSFIENVVFVVYSDFLNAKNDLTWWDIVTGESPFLYARRVEGDLALAYALVRARPGPRCIFPKLKELFITAAVTTFTWQWGAEEQFELEQIKALKEKCAKYKVKFTAYVIMRGFRTLGTRDYGQWVFLVIRGNKVIDVKEVKRAQKKFYEETRDLVRNVFQNELPEMNYQGRRKLLGFQDKQVEWRGETA